MIQQISLENCLKLAYQFPGLVIGPDATCHTHIFQDLLKIVVEQYPNPVDPPPSDYYTAYDTLRQLSHSQLPIVEEAIRNYILELSTPSTVQNLTRGRWGLAVSLTPDLLFEDAVRLKFEKAATSWTATLIDHPSVTPTGQTFPIYKLLGNIRDARKEFTLALGASDLLIRRQDWRSLLRTLSDYLRDAPLLFVGTGTIIPTVRDFLTELFASPPPYPSRLVFLKGDGTSADPTIQAIAGRYSTITEVDASLKDFCDATAVTQPNKFSAAKVITSSQLASNSGLISILGTSRSLVELVPTSLPPDFDIPANRLRMIDGLFRPTALDWTPYLAELELPREDVTRIINEVTTKLEYLPKHPQPTILLKGEAGIGKTTTAKSAAIRLAKSGNIVLWCKRSQFQAAQTFRTLAKEFRKWLRTPESKGKSIIVICDDPWSLRLSPSEMVSAFEDAEVPAVFIFIVRSSDSVLPDSGQQLLPGTPDVTLDLAYQLSPEEIRELGPFLVRVGAALDDTAASLAIRNIPTQNAEDILCSLWYLLPQTRSTLSVAIQDEYIRLGGITGVITNLAESADEIGKQARTAYEIVAVTSKLEIGLALEVMLRAAEMNYSEWLDISKDGKPLWGLLYDEIDEETSNIVFFTRNEVVTNVLVGLINGGFGHAGEFRALKQILSACYLGTPPYRSAVVDILVRSRRKLESILSFEQGVELYELALSVFPEQDRALRHHYGLWCRDKGRDSQRAYLEYQKALDTDDYKYSSKSEPVELIHTSMAAAVVESVSDGLQDRTTGLELVRDHLRQASNPRFFNPHSAHVFANLLFKLSQHNSTRVEDQVISLESVADALHTIERMLQIIGAQGRKRLEFSKNIQVLSDLQTKILESVEDTPALREHAEELLTTTGNQTACEVVGRKLLQAAIRTDKGSDFKLVSDYIDHVAKRIQALGNTIGLGLLTLRVDLTIRWRLQKTRGPIDWVQLRDDLQTILASPNYHNDFIKMYYYGIALYHCAEYTKGNVIFEMMRTQIRPTWEVRRALRNCLVGPEGFPHRLQGTYNVHHERASVFCPDLGTDVQAVGSPTGAGNGATVHFYIAFSMNGPLAVFEAPTANEFILP